MKRIAIEDAVPESFYQIRKDEAGKGAEDNEVASQDIPLSLEEIEVGKAEEKGAKDRYLLQRKPSQDKETYEREDEGLLEEDIERLGQKISHIEREEEHLRILHDDGTGRREERGHAQVDPGPEGERQPKDRKGDSGETPA